MDYHNNLKINKFEKQLIDFFREFGISRGQSPKIATIIAYLSIYESLTQQELRELTNFSLGSISTNLNYMLSMELIGKKMIKGKRKQIFSYYILEMIKSFHNLYFKKTILIRSEQMSKFIEFLQLKGMELKDHLEHKNARELIENLEEVKTYLQKLKQIFDNYKDFITD